MTAVTTREEQQEQRRAVTVAALEAPGKGLADQTDAEFEANCRRITKGQERMEKILATTLRPEIHFGNPNNAFQSPILYKAGAEELRKLMRLRVRRIADPQIEATEQWVSVTVHMGIFDEMNRMLAERTANCNTLEKRFRNKRGEWTYRDPREMVHQCLAMAEKRAAADLTEEASGATGYFQTEKALMEGIEDGVAVEGASSTDKLRIKDAALAKKMTRPQFFDLIIRTTNRPMTAGQDEPFIAADEVAGVLDAIERWQRPAKVETEVVESKPAPSGDPFAPDDDGFPR